ncbi:hypothetical protein [Nostoc sp.]
MERLQKLAGYAYAIKIGERFFSGEMGLAVRQDDPISDIADR